MLHLECGVNVREQKLEAAGIQPAGGFPLACRGKRIETQLVVRKHFYSSINWTSLPFKKPI